MRETDKGASSISSTPHSSASHQSAEVRVGLTSASRTGLPIHLTLSTKSLRLPSLSAIRWWQRFHWAPNRAKQ